MKNKYGFTLIELMGVIVLIGIITIIVGLPFLKQIKKTKTKIDDATKEVIVVATSNYINENKNDFSIKNGYIYCVKLQTLIDENKLSKETKDSNGDIIDFNQYVKVAVSNNDYHYSIEDSCQIKTTIDSYVLNTYNYSGKTEVFVAPYTGLYKIELWGAEGGYYSDYVSGKGAYVSGEIQLNAKEILYVTVGQSGMEADVSNAVSLGGFNGGGYTYYGAGTGGGATDIRYADTTLNDRIMVAGGGGGTGIFSRTQTGGSGGTFVGYSGGNYFNETYNGDHFGKGGTQIAGGVPGEYWTGEERANCIVGSAGLFGLGGNGGHEASFSHGSGAGGGGYYGGGGGSERNGGGGGGSSYISGHAGCVAITSKTNTKPLSNIANGTADISYSYHYSGKIFTNTVMISGNDTMPTHDGLEEMVGNRGHGYAKISFLG